MQHIGQKIDVSEGLLIRLKRFQNQRLAHHDAIVAGDVSLPYGEVHKLVEEIKSMYNTLPTVTNWLIILNAMLGKTLFDIAGK